MDRSINKILKDVLEKELKRLEKKLSKLNASRYNSKEHNADRLSFLEAIRNSDNKNILLFGERIKVHETKLTKWCCSKEMQKEFDLEDEIETIKSELTRRVYNG